VPGEIGRSAIRNVLTAAIIHVTDETPPAAELVLSAEPSAYGLVLTLTLRPTDGDKGFATEPVYRPLEWADLEALAAAESVTLTREGRQRVHVSIPWASRRN
jgi:hypothetical protein